MVRILIALAIGLLLSLDAHAQLQPVYNRPLKGESFIPLDFNGVPLTDLTINAGTIFTSKAVEWSAFSGVFVQVSIDQVPGACTHSPQILVVGHEKPPATQATWLLNYREPDSPNDSVFFDTDSGSRASYGLTTKHPWLSIGVLFPLVTGHAGVACKLSVRLVPLPFNPDAAETRFSASAEYGVKSVTTNPTRLGPGLLSGQYQITVQNQSTAVVFCAPVSKVGKVLSTTSYGVSLAAGAVAKDGTGGSFTFPKVRGDVFCLVAAGAANVSWFAH